jgi:hypothetical protein
MSKYCSREIKNNDLDFEAFFKEEPMCDLIMIG